MAAISRRNLFGALGVIALGNLGHARAQELARFPDSDWELVAPADVELAAAQLDAAGDYAAANMPDITGIVVVRSNGLAYERYFGDEYGIDDPVNIRSITKC